MYDDVAGIVKYVGEPLFSRFPVGLRKVKLIWSRLLSVSEQFICSLMVDPDVIELDESELPFNEGFVKSEIFIIWLLWFRLFEVSLAMTVKFMTLFFPTPI